MRTIRHTTEADFPAVERLIDTGRQKMRATGNMNQWVDGYPKTETLHHDIEAGNGYVVEEDGRMIATFAFIPGPDPTYLKIYDGAWIEDTSPYHVIHRIASAQGAKGVLADVLRWTETVTPNMRIDTHRDNVVMRHLLEKLGFTYCGIIYLADGAERLAYQRIVG